ncbi:MAG: COX15/CtaA family protein [Saprospiraceae bacterium]|nr:COX15/CtaA family protein [Saprospiraceae bacterium]
MENKKHQILKLWLWTGVVMVLVQFLLGSVTRLTGSGLSITEWNVVSGVIYPFNDEMWNKEFDLYKAKPQYSKLTYGMSLAEFKFIYFWEYFHRLWARFIAFVFFIPFIYFVVKKMIPKKMILQFGIVVLLGAVEGFMGWIMVQSGLKDRPWVNAYKLSFHLCFATLIIGFLYWILWNYNEKEIERRKVNFNLAFLVCVMIFIQIFLGGVMSGMRAGLVAPTWPDINGKLIPLEVNLLFSESDNLFHNYEQNHISGIIIQFFHRMWAYIIFITIVLISFNHYKKKDLSHFNKSIKLVGLLLFQMILGIFTVIQCKGSIPVWLGVSHQITGIIVFLVSLNYWFGFFRSRYKIDELNTETSLI